MSRVIYVAVGTSLGVLSIVAIAAALLLTSALLTPPGRNRMLNSLAGLERHPIVWAWVVALIAAVGSLYFSEIAHLVPCSLCWYQRIAMYPLVLVLGVGTARRDTGVWRYALPLAVLGLLVALYHVTIEWMPALDVGVCTSGVPCTMRYFAVFGFISIATMSAAAFLLVAALMLVLRVLDSEVVAD